MGRYPQVITWMQRTPASTWITESCQYRHLRRWHRREACMAQAAVEPHTHGIDLRSQYIDVIIGVKA